MKKHSIIPLYFVFISFFISLNATYKAFVAVPVADLVGIPLITTKQYNTLPLCGGKTNPFTACIRMNQLLFNEIVEVLEEKNGQVKVSVPHLFFITKQNKKPHTTYWMDAKNIVPLSQIHGNLNKIPRPFNFKKKDMSMAMHNTIVLLKPQYDSNTGHSFSAGTRFVQVRDKQVKKSNSYKVYAFDHKKMKFKIIILPKNSCLVQSKNQTKTQQIQQFVKILQQWAHLNNGNIPYVWGGCSFIHASNSPFIEQTTIQNKKTCSFFTRSDCSGYPKTGLDCTGLIARAAQIAGIPYFLKNSTTIAHYLKPLKKGQAVEEGDLIWIDRHAMIVSNVQKNLLIEARHYSHGYGNIHEISLNEQFKNIRTYKELTHAMLNKQKVERINRKGDIVEVIPEIKVFKLVSVWA